MEKSFRVIWELDVDADDAFQAARLARIAIINKAAPVFEVHQWDEPDMRTATPVALIDLEDRDADLPMPHRREFSEPYMGPTII